MPTEKPWPAMIMRAAPDNPIKGKRVAIAGAIQNLTRREAEYAVSRLGGYPSKSITRNTDLVVIGRSAKSKLDKARSLGIPEMTSEEFLSLISRFHIDPSRERLED